MIIRVVSTISLILLLILVLYLPSAHPPERFITQLSVEHERNRPFGVRSMRCVSCRACSSFTPTRSRQAPSPTPSPLLSRAAKSTPRPHPRCRR